MFEIKIAKEKSSFFGEASYEGSIRLPDRVEKFYAPAVYWAREDYISQWRRSLFEGLQNKTHSALITSMYDPTLANFITLWVLYYENERAFLQNQIFFLESVPEVFDVLNINKYIGGREIFDEDGEKISEWAFDRREIEFFIDKVISNM